MCSPAATPTHDIDQRHIADVSRLLTTRHRLDPRPGLGRAPLLQGHMQLHELQPGMFLRLADVRDRYDMLSEAELRPGLKLALVLAGRAEVAFGGTTILLGPEEDSAGVIVAVDSAMTFRRWGRRNGAERTLTLTLTPDWLERRLGLTRPSQALPQREGPLPWQPTPALQALATSLFVPFHGTAPVAQRLRLEGIALSLLGEALGTRQSQLAAHTMVPVLPGAGLAKLRKLIDSGEAETLTQQELAQRTNMSLSQMQRRFRDCFDISLGHYLRRRRLESARQALGNEAISVETAAARAGYTSAANFATAFKREFGVTPSEYSRQRHQD